ncbi:MAG TPA: BON domain-containing protein [Bryobacteraceae bacterium]|nr:BON domain-containing protein [Bryobacteraceae bacterium]
MRGHLLIAISLLACAGLAGAATQPPANTPPDDASIIKNVRHEILTYPNYSIWDDVSFRVMNGNVELLGAVNQPFKKDDLGRLVKGVAGVESVSNQLKVLPLSFQDDSLRLQVARAIYTAPSLSRYAIQAVPPIHIIVDNGQVTLTGVVNNTAEKEIAGMRAATAGLSFGNVINNLQVENPPARKG